MLALLIGTLGGCATSDDQAARLLVPPGNYDLYSCPQLAREAQRLRSRKLELERLMARANVDAGGRLMSALGYRPDYLQVSGELHEVERTGREKHCDLSANPERDVPAAPTPRAKRVSPAR